MANVESPELLKTDLYLLYRSCSISIVEHSKLRDIHIKISGLCALRYHRTFATRHRLASALEFGYRNTRPSFSIQKPRLLLPGVLDPRTFLVFLLSSEPFRPPPGTFKHAVFH